MKASRLFVLAVGTLFGAVPSFADRPLAVALFVDEGCRGAGVAIWADILSDSPDVAVRIVKGADIRAGGLDGAELLVMPGGAGGPQYEALGDVGAERIRAFVARGGTYFGTCCGLSNTLNEELPFAKRIKMIPYRNIPPFGRGGMMLNVALTDAGVDFFALAEREWTIRYHNGPVLEPSDPIPACSSCDVLATITAGPLVGTPAILRATYGTGTILGFNCHPESREETRALIVAGIRALTGRTIRIVPPAKRVFKGPHLLLVTPYNADATVDIPVLLKEADYVARQDVGGIIWPSAGEEQGVFASGSYEKGLSALARHFVQKGYTAKLVAVSSGTNTAQAVAHAAIVERIARETGASMGILARPADDATNQVMILDHYRALAKVTTLPTIIQTYNGKSPQPSIETLLTLIKNYPANYGFVKEESPGLTVNGRMQELLQHSEVRGVLSGWGGKGWIFQGSQIGTCGVISQRPAYASLFAKIYARLAAGADASDPELADAYTKYLYMANLGDIFSKWGDDEMRGDHLYVLQKLGIFRNRLSLVDVGKVEEYEMTDEEKREVEARMNYCGLLK